MYKYIPTKELLTKITNLSKVERQILIEGATIISTGRQLRFKFSPCASQLGSKVNPARDKFHAEQVLEDGVEYIETVGMRDPFAAPINSTLY